jgi:hypothetical protein
VPDGNTKGCCIIPSPWGKSVTAPLDPTGENIDLVETYTIIRLAGSWAEKEFLGTWHQPGRNIDHREAATMASLDAVNDDELQMIGYLAWADRRCRDLMRQYRGAIYNVATAALERKTVDGEEIAAIVAGSPFSPLTSRTREHFYDPHEVRNPFEITEEMRRGR